MELIESDASLIKCQQSRYMCRVEDQPKTNKQTNKKTEKNG